MLAKWSSIWMRRSSISWCERQSLVAGRWSLAKCRFLASLGTTIRRGVANDQRPTTSDQRRTTMTQIKFGTDGWRGLIADDFTFDNVRRVAGAIASYVLKHEDPTRGVVVGYDTRFLSDRAARVVAEVIAAAGIPVLLANDYVPTPAVSYNVKQLGAAGGVIVTSSHNPWNWNGVKFKAKFGGSATPAIMKAVEDELGDGAGPSARLPIPSPGTATSEVPAPTDKGHPNPAHSHPVSPCPRLPPLPP